MVIRSRWCNAFLVSTLLFSACSDKTVRSLPGNQLAQATSPYLREHADNPVHWFEWGKEALEKATRENKPIIISIGYASCHWCHVMEEETFMDTAVARMMNKNFISIKIDREERPDIDQIYINASQLITGHAGWPLNAFALPDGKPFYAGTYFTTEQWKSLLDQISKGYRDDFENVKKQANAVTEGVAINEIEIQIEEGKQHLKPTHEIVAGWDNYFDYQEGGLKGAPKFPMPVVWEFLLQENYFSENRKALEAITTTLDAMANGGIYDHLAGGFARYSTDAQWKVPHFEKMLYDNGQLVSLYAHGYKATGNERYHDVIEQTLTFVKDNLTSPEGSFYSSLNADSEGEEGTFYVWTKNEIENILGADRAKLVYEYYNIIEEGNWERNKNVLFRTNSIEELAGKQKQKRDELENIIRESNELLLNARNKRVHPSLDDKILTSWNALMLTGYIDAYWATGNSDYLSDALKNGEFMKSIMMREDGHLFRSYSQNKASIDGFLDDYALQANAFIQLYQATFDIQWLNDAKKIVDYAVTHFKDDSTGFFFYTSNESPTLIARKMEVADQVMPSSNAVMVEVLFKLGTYFSDDNYLSQTKRILQSFPDGNFAQGPYYAKWATVMGLVSREPFEVAIVGSDATIKSRELMKNYLPGVFLLGGNEENLPLLENKQVNGKTIIYVCRNKVCKLPVVEVADALEQLK